MSKEYIIKQYKLAMLDFELARCEDDQWNARKQMASLETFASAMYGFELSDSLRSQAAALTAADLCRS